MLGEPGADVESPVVERGNERATASKSRLADSVLRWLPATSASRVGAACLLLSTLPIAFAVWFVQGFSLVMPRFDQWSLFITLSRLASGVFSAHDFLFPHNDLHLPLLPRIMLAPLAIVTSWSLRAEVYLGLCLVTYTAFILYRAFDQTAVRRETRYLIGLFSVALLFSPSQDFLWTWGPGVFHYSTNACIATTVWALARKRPSVGIAIASAIAATFSRFEGMFSWIVFFPAVVAATAELERRNRALFLWGAAGTLSSGVVLGLIAYVGGASELSELGQATDMAIAPRLKMALSLIGMPAAMFTEAAGVAPTHAYWPAGLIVLGVLVAASVKLVFSPSDRRNRALPWICLGAFGFVFAAATATVRQEVHMGLRLHVSCYSPTGSLVAISTLHVVALALAEYRPPRGLPVRYLRRLAAAVGACVVILNYVHVMPRLSARRSEGHWDRYSVELAHYFAPPKNQSSWFKFPEMAAAFEGAGFGEPAKNLVFDEGASFGRIEAITSGTEPLNGLSVAVVVGWAALPDEDAGTVALAFGNDRRIKTAATQITPRDGGIQWVAKLSWSVADTDPRPLRAWAYDRRAKCFRRLDGQAQLRLATVAK